MKRFPLICAALLIGGMAFAEPPVGAPAGGPRGAPPFERLASDLGLDDTQAAEVKRILDAQRSRMEAERAQFESSGQRPTREQMRARHEQATLELRQQLTLVLTAEQMTKFDEMRQRQGPPPQQRP
jgi:hypothetical protein